MSTQREQYANLVGKLPGVLRTLNWQFTGFPEWARREIRKADIENLLQGEQIYKAPRFVPDAFYADEETRVVYILEIVNTNDISEEKAARIVEGFWVLDYAEWQLVLLKYYPKMESVVLIDSLALADGRARQYEGKTPHPMLAVFDSLQENITCSLLQQEAQLARS